MEFDNRDKKLISYLYHNCDEPLTKIAKACKLSRDQVEYRLKKYEEQKLIRKYLTIFNYNLLGYNEFVIVWLKLSATEEKKNVIKKQLENMENTLSVGDVLADYDLFVNFIFKTKLEFEKVFYSFVEKNKQSIVDYFVFPTTFSRFFPLKEFDLFNKDRSYSITDIVKSGPIKLNEKDVTILKELEKNARVKIIDISAKANLSSELIVYKIKNFYKRKIILGTRIQFDMGKFGFFFSLLRIKFKNLNDSLKNKIITFCENHKYVNALTFGISDYNCIIQMFYKEEENLRKTIKDIKMEFNKEISKSEVLLLENEGRVNTLPY